MRPILPHVLRHVGPPLKEAAHCLCYTLSRDTMAFVKQDAQHRHAVLFDRLGDETPTVKLGTENFLDNLVVQFRSSFIARIIRHGRFEWNRIPTWWF